MYNAEMITQGEIFSKLIRRQVLLPPLSFRVLDKWPANANAKTLIRPDLILEIERGSRQLKFAVEVKASNRPVAIEAAVSMAEKCANDLAKDMDGVFPMIIVPWLSPEQLAKLESRGVSGVDLCGNGVVVVPGEILVYKSGNPNLYPQSEPLRSVYKGDSSMVARTFLVRAKYESLKDVAAEMKIRQEQVAISTISRVLTVLRDDLIISRQAREIKLLQPDRLLEALSANFQPAKILDTQSAKFSIHPDQMIGKLRSNAGGLGQKLALTGASSADRYAVMAREPVFSFYCTQPPWELLADPDLDLEPHSHFPNLILFWTQDKSVFFDCRNDGPWPVASPIQTWLELMAGEKRQQEIAAQVKRLILAELSTSTGGQTP